MLNSKARRRQGVIPWTLEGQFFTTFQGDLPSMGANGTHTAGLLYYASVDSAK